MQVHDKCPPEQRNRVQELAARHLFDDSKVRTSDLSFCNPLQYAKHPHVAVSTTILLRTCFTFLPNMSVQPTVVIDNLHVTERLVFPRGVSISCMLWCTCHQSDLNYFQVLDSETDYLFYLSLSEICY